MRMYDTSSAKRRLARAIALAALVTAATGGCSDPGRISVRFTWADAPPEKFDGLFIHASVEERTEEDVPGKVLGADVVALEPTVSLSLDQIPNGTRRVVVVEITPAGRETLK